MAPVAKILHSSGVLLLRYLDNWLVLATSEEACRRMKELILNLCKELGIVINMEKTSLTPTQVMTYLGMDINFVTLRASPTRTRQETLIHLIGEFLLSRERPAASWRRLL